MKHFRQVCLIIYLLAVQSELCVSDSIFKQNLPVESSFQTQEKDFRLPWNWNDQSERNFKSFNDIFPPVGKSYWIPYGDRTAAAMSFPIITSEIFTPVILKHHIEVDGQHGEKFNKKGDFLVPESDLGVVVSRNSILKRNFRDYMNLNMYEGDTKASDELLIEVARQLAESQLLAKKGQSFVIVAFESRFKTLKGEKRTKIDDSQIFHNGTIIFPRISEPGVLTVIPFSLKTLNELKTIIRDDVMPDSHHHKVQTKMFVNLISGVHEDTLVDGIKAFERLQQRVMKLDRPKFFVEVEKVPGDTRDDTDDKIQRDKIFMDEETHRNEAWFSTSTIGIRTISNPQIIQNLVPVAHEVHLPLIVQPQSELLVKNVQATQENTNK